LTARADGIVAMRKLNFAEHEHVARVAITVASNKEGSVLGGLIKGFQEVGKPLSATSKRKLSRKMCSNPRQIIDWILEGYDVDQKLAPFKFSVVHESDCKKDSNSICDCDPLFTVDGEIYSALANESK
jgi:hypothetical protein